MTRQALVVVLALMFSSCGARTGLGDPPRPCVELPLGEPSVRLDLAAPRRVGAVDVVLLVDTSLSGRYSFSGLEDALRAALPRILEFGDDVRIGVASFSDFGGPECTGPFSDALPFRSLTPPTSDIEILQAALAACFASYAFNDDTPESNVEALYQLATGEGVEPYVRPGPACPPDSRGGYHCFRIDAQPIVIHFADSPFHEGPGGVHPYPSECADGQAHTYDEALAALRAIDAKVASIHPSTIVPETLAHLRALAEDTGAIGPSGPLVRTLGDAGNTIATVVRTLATLVDAIAIDITAELVDPDPFDDIDPRRFVERVEPVSAIPATGVESIDLEHGIFVGVTGDTRVIFAVRLRNDAVVPGPSAERFLLEVRFVSAGRLLGVEQVEIVVPGADGSGC